MEIWADLMKQKIALVTGANGTIGRYVARALAAREWHVLGLGHGGWQAAEQTEWGLSSWDEGDVTLTSLRALELRPRLIVHCAGSGAVGPSITAPHTDFQRTVETTAAVAEFLRVDCPGAVLVYPSSAAVYGIADCMPMLEGMPRRPVSPYGFHKKIAEDLVVEHARLFGLNAAVVRLFSIYGEGLRKQLLWDACQRLRRGEILFSGTGGETRDWLHVTDAAALLIRAGENASPACPVVNGGAGEAVTLADFLGHLFVCWGRDDAPRFTGSGRLGDPEHYQADVRAARAWGWAPAVGWQSGVARYVDWFKREMAITR